MDDVGIAAEVGEQSCQLSAKQLELAFGQTGFAESSRSARAPIANCQLPTANCQLPTANCQLQLLD
jgi:hypothetical protein